MAVASSGNYLAGDYIKSGILVKSRSAFFASCPMPRPLSPIDSTKNQQKTARPLRVDLQPTRRARTWSVITRRARSGANPKKARKKGAKAEKRTKLCPFGPTPLPQIIGARQTGVVFARSQTNKKRPDLFGPAL